MYLILFSRAKTRIKCKFYNKTIVEFSPPPNQKDKLLKKQENNPF